MLRFAVMLILFIASSSGSSNISEDYESDVRITGGGPTTITEFPYQLALYKRLGTEYLHFGGGSVLSNTWVLTAAHLVDGTPKEEIQLRSGSTFKDRGGNLHDLDTIIVHPSYGGNVTLDYDIAVLKISGTFDFTDVVKPITLVQMTPVAGSWAVVTGWGALRNQGERPLQLHKVEIRIINHRTCVDNYRFYRPVTPRMLCAGIPQDEKDACVGDSGGPLVVDGEQVGVVSWGRICGRSIGVYADVARLRPWIISTTGVR